MNHSPPYRPALQRHLIKRVLLLLWTLLAIATPITIASCTSLLDATPSRAETISTNWSDRLAEIDWPANWTIRSRRRWGDRNLEIVSTPGEKFPAVLRVHYPAGSASPTVARQTGAPIGGAQFYVSVGVPPQNSFRLSYDVRFRSGFNFVKGGKLPGLFGGTGNSGRDIPNGTDGFSTRYMWRRNGVGEIYAYLPSSREHGTSIGRGNWRFEQGKWHHLTQEVVLNQPGRNNGTIRVWLDNRRVLERSNLTFRTTNRLRLEGMLFSTFFGGSDRTWATPVDTYVDFANFSIE